MKIKAIGIGGVGCQLLPVLARFLCYQGKTRGVVIHLIDGDSYEEKNRGRQVFLREGNKADVKVEELRKDFLKIKFVAHPEYVDRANLGRLIRNGDTVMLMVDNHKTRKIVSDHCRRLKNIVLISGGCELTDGTVQVYVKERKKELTPLLTYLHPEIENPTDKSPTEMDCQELAASSEPQLFFTNVTVATFMANAFYAVLHLQKKLPYAEVYFDILAGKTKTTEVKKW